MTGNCHVRFLGGKGAARLLTYPVLWYNDKINRKALYNKGDGAARLTPSGSLSLDCAVSCAAHLHVRQGRMKKSQAIVLSILVAALVLPVASYVAWVRPGQSGILARGARSAET